jgi:hypothetical protein
MPAISHLGGTSRSTLIVNASVDSDSTKQRSPQCASSGLVFRAGQAATSDVFPRRCTRPARLPPRLKTNSSIGRENKIHYCMSYRCVAQYSRHAASARFSTTAQPQRATMSRASVPGERPPMPTPLTMPTPPTPTAPDPAAPGSQVSVFCVFEVLADMESLHPADACESLLTLPDAEPEPAPLSTAVPDPAASGEIAPTTRTGPGRQRHARRAADVGACVDADQTILCHQQLGAAPTQTGRRRINNCRRQRNFAVRVDPDGIIGCREGRDASLTRTGPGRDRRSRRAQTLGVCVEPQSVILCHQHLGSPPTQTGRRRDAHCHRHGCDPPLPPGIAPALRAPWRSARGCRGSLPAPRPSGR